MLLIEFVIVCKPYITRLFFLSICSFFLCLSLLCAPFCLSCPSIGYYFSFPFPSLNFSCFPVYVTSSLPSFIFFFLIFPSPYFYFRFLALFALILFEQESALCHIGSLYRYEGFQAANTVSHVHSKQPAFTVLTWLQTAPPVSWGSFPGVGRVYLMSTAF